MLCDMPVRASPGLPPPLLAAKKHTHTLLPRNLLSPSEALLFALLCSPSMREADTLRVRFRVLHTWHESHATAFEQRSLPTLRGAFSLLCSQEQASNCVLIVVARLEANPLGVFA